MAINIADLGLTQEELQDRVVQGICDRFLTMQVPDEDGNPVEVPAPIRRTIDTLIQERIREKVTDICERHVLPKVSGMVDSLILQETNKWGEKIGAPLTFIEYLTKRADEYLQEKVNFEGKVREPCYASSNDQTRLTYLIHRHLSFSIENAMKAAVNQVNAAICPALAETAKAKLAEISKTLEMTIKAR